MRSGPHRWVVPIALAVALAAAPGASAAGPRLTAPGSGAGIADPQTVIVAGDIAGCDWTGDSETAALISRLPGLVMTAGDDAYPAGTPEQFTACYGPTWGAFRSRTRPVPGNHDHVTPGAAGYFGYFGRRAGPPGRGYYAFDLGSWRIYALDSVCSAVGGCGRGDPQLEWLRADLAARPHACVLAVWHHPRFSSGPHGDAVWVAGLTRVLYQAGAEIVVNGHDHVYERFAPARPNGDADPVRGIRQFIVGTGGAALYGFGTAPSPTSEVRDASTHGVLRLTLGEGSYAWEFLPTEAGGFTDSGTGTCH